MQQEAGVELDAVDKRYGAVEALRGVSLRVAPQEIVALVGPSGCGKSTLLELVCGLQAPEAGTVRAGAAALMPQRDALLPWLSALDNAGLALRVAGVSRARARALAHEHFAAFGLEGFEAARPAALSGGMRQRVAFLRTLLAGRPVLCLDEPFGALDALTRLQMQRWLAGALEREPRTVLLVTHDVEEAVLLADRVVLLSPRPGRVVEALEVGLPRPRERDDRAVVALRERALRVLGADGGDAPGRGVVPAPGTAALRATAVGAAHPEGDA
jgi:ABC-type nitrate/sulfonate/bicarbonate transport system ATPase subunit